MHGRWPADISHTSDSLVVNGQTLELFQHARLEDLPLANLIPTTTGSATAIAMIFPELAGRLNGHAVRVPLLNASLTDLVLEMARPVTVAEVNTLLQTWADGPSTMVVNDTQLKLYLWYDNEWGYTNRLVDIVQMVANKL